MDQCELQFAWAHEQLEVRAARFALPGIVVTTRGVTLPLVFTEGEQATTDLWNEARGDLAIEIADLTPWEDDLPETLLDLMPLSAEFAVGVQDGEISITKGSILGDGVSVQVLDGAASIASLRAFAHETNPDIQLLRPLVLEARVPKARAFAIPGYDEVIGSGSLRIKCEGSLHDPKVEANALLEDLASHHLHIDGLQLRGAWRGKEITLDTLRIENLVADGGGSSPLEDARAARSSSIEVRGLMKLRGSASGGLEPDVLDYEIDATLDPRWLHMASPSRQAAKIVREAVAFRELRRTRVQRDRRAATRPRIGQSGDSRPGHPARTQRRPATATEPHRIRRSNAGRQAHAVGHAT